MTYRDVFLDVVDEIKAADPVPIDLLMQASGILAAWQHAGGDHVAPVPLADPKQIAAEIEALDARRRALYELHPGSVPNSGR